MSGVDYLIERLEREYNSFPLLNSDECIKAKYIEYKFLEQIWYMAIEVGWELGSEQGDSSISQLTLSDIIEVLNGCRFKVGDRVAWVNGYNAIIDRINLDGTYRIRFWLGEIDEHSGTCVHYHAKDSDMTYENTK